MAISVEEILGLAVERFKEKIDEVVAAKVAPLAAQLEKVISDVKAQGENLSRERPVKVKLEVKPDPDTK